MRPQACWRISSSMTSQTEPINTRQDVSLLGLNSLALPAVARQLYSVSSAEQLQQVLQYFRENAIKPLILGEGSNVVLARNDYPHCLRIATCGIQLLEQTDEYVTLDIAAGENWNDLVNHCLDQGYFGLENLALIPGTVGAAPIQNIGAYGVELSEFVEQVQLINLQTLATETVDNEQCEFAYRDSVFKNRYQDRYIITQVRLKLRKKAVVNCNYKSLAEELADISGPSPEDVRDAVVRIRQSKLPDPAAIPNAGSFFKNPLVKTKRLAELEAEHPGLVSYATTNPHYSKLAAGWLLEKAGWKGHRREHVGVHNEQALVLVNNGTATGADLLALADDICADIKAKFALDLQIEPRVYR